MSSRSHTSTRIGGDILQRAAREAFVKLDPRRQVRNPVMFVVWVGSLVTTGLFIAALAGKGEEPPRFILTVAIWLWFTVLFANFAEAVAEGRGRAQAESLRRARRDLIARKLARVARDASASPIPASDLRKGDLVLVEAGEFIPADGDVVEGIASVDESAVTGESAPVIRESGGDRSAVTGGTRVLSDWMIVKVTANPGETFLDRMIAMVEGARRRKTPNEIALTILLAGDDDHLPDRLCDAAALLDLRRGECREGRAGHGDGPRRTPGLPHPDHDRGPALGDRYRGHGPPAAGERHGDVGQGGGDGRRRGRPPAGQDGNHHPRRPAGRGVSSRRRSRRGDRRRGRAAGLARRRDARGAEHRRPGEDGSSAFGRSTSPGWARGSFPSARRRG